MKRICKSSVAQAHSYDPREGETYELHIPYGQPEELLMDILNYDPDVEVIAPGSLRGDVHARIEQTLNTYSSG